MEYDRKVTKMAETLNFKVRMDIYLSNCLVLKLLKASMQGTNII